MTELLERMAEKLADNEWIEPNCFRGKYIFISGPMTGEPDLNAVAFNLIEGYLNGKGAAAVFNPVTLARNAPKHESVENLKRYELAWITYMADIVYMLPGWEDSEGARLEYEVAKACGLDISGAVYPKRKGGAK